MTLSSSSYRHRSIIIIIAIRTVGVGLVAPLAQLLHGLVPQALQDLLPLSGVVRLVAGRGSVRATVVTSDLSAVTQIGDQSSAGMCQSHANEGRLCAYSTQLHTGAWLALY